jgi:hypothetical protein
LTNREETKNSVVVAVFPSQVKNHVFPYGRYTGQLINGLRDGYGVFEFTDGSKYSGDWKGDKMNGKGKLKYEIGKEYEGGFKDNMFHGQGRY